MIHENTYGVITIKVAHSVIVEIDSGLDNQTLYHLLNELYDSVVILICKGLFTVVYKDANFVYNVLACICHCVLMICSS